MMEVAPLYATATFCYNMHISKFFHAVVRRKHVARIAELRELYQYGEQQMLYICCRLLAHQEQGVRDD